VKIQTGRKVSPNNREQNECKVNECIHTNTPLRVTPEHENKNNIKYESIEGDHEEEKN